MSKRLGLIDVGTNSARLLVADIETDGAWCQVSSGRVPCRLGEQLSETGAIQDIAIERTAAALRELTAQAEAVEVEELVIVATHALRVAKNSKAVVAHLRQVAKRDLLVLSGEQEAHLVFEAACRHVDVTDHDRLVALDLGGGSLELARRQDSERLEWQSLALGSVVMASRLSQEDQVDSEDLQRFRADICSMLIRDAPGFQGTTTQVAAAGGTVTTAAALAGAASPLTGYRLSKDVLESLLQQWALQSGPSRGQHPAIRDRADIIVGGIAILCEALAFVGAEQLVVMEHGVREGGLLLMSRGQITQKKVRPS